MGSNNHNYGNDNDTFGFNNYNCGSDNDVLRFDKDSLGFNNDDSGSDNDILGFNNAKWIICNQNFLMLIELFWDWFYRKAVKSQRWFVFLKGDNFKS